MCEKSALVGLLLAMTISSLKVVELSQVFGQRFSDDIFNTKGGQKIFWQTDKIS